MDKSAEIHSIACLNWCVSHTPAAIEFFLDWAGKTQAQLAAYFGKPPAWASQRIRGYKKDGRHRYAQVKRPARMKMAEFFGADPDVFEKACQFGPESIELSPRLPPGKPTKMLARNRPGIPVLNVAPAGPTGDFGAIDEEEVHALDYIDPGNYTQKQLKRMFAVRVFGASMEPALMNGAVAICEHYGWHGAQHDFIDPGTIVFVRFTEEFRYSQCALVLWYQSKDGRIALRKWSPEWSSWKIECNPQDIWHVARVIERRDIHIPRMPLPPVSRD